MTHDEFLRYWPSVRARTTRLISLIPADRFFGRCAVHLGSAASAQMAKRGSEANASADARECNQIVTAPMPNTW